MLAFWPSAHVADFTYITAFIDTCVSSSRKLCIVGLSELHDRMKLPRHTDSIGKQALLTRLY